jgi:hypothetical protein
VVKGSLHVLDRIDLAAPVASCSDVYGIASELIVNFVHAVDIGKEPSTVAVVAIR